MTHTVHDYIALSFDICVVQLRLRFMSLNKNVGRVHLTVGSEYPVLICRQSIKLGMLPPDAQRRDGRTHRSV